MRLEDLMSKQGQSLFLEEWLMINTNGATNTTTFRNSTTPSTQTIIQSWAELRTCLHQSTFQPIHFNSLKTLLNLHSSLYVTDPQAKLLISILSAPNMSVPFDAYPLFFRLLYIWVRKSSKPTSYLIDSTVDVVDRVFVDWIGGEKSSSLFVEGVLLVGALSYAPTVSPNAKRRCLELLCRMVEVDHGLIGSVGGRLSDVLAGVGYGLCSCEDVYFLRLLSFVFRDWVRIEVCHDVSRALLILHLVEWVVFALVNAGSMKKINVFSSEVLEHSSSSKATFGALMATAGALRASKRPVRHGEMMSVVSRLRVSAESKMDDVAKDVIEKVAVYDCVVIVDRELSFLLQCLSISVARSGGLSSTKGPLLVCLALALSTEIFPLRRFYNTILVGAFENSDNLISVGVKDHQDSILFKEAGATTGVFCSLYATANEEDKLKVEDLVWGFCHNIYLEHRKVSFLLQGRFDELLNNLEKIAEPAFLMTVVFALAVIKHRLTPKFSKEIQMVVSVKILVSFSCLEYFRRIRLPEYMETVRSTVACVQENELALSSFVESLPSYVDLTNPQEFPYLQNVKYTWYKDDVQTARILFYLRVIPTAITRLRSDLFRDVVASMMFLYMRHPNDKVSLASHAVFSSFISSDEGNNSLKEQLVFYYMKRSLEAYPAITPFEGLASGVSALVRYLPAGSPSIYYCIHNLVEKANMMCQEVMAQQIDSWKNLQGDTESCNKLLELLLRLISLVDIQVLPELMKLIAQLVLQLPKQGQNMALNNLYGLVAESDDVTRKPTLVSWLQSLSFLCSHTSRGKASAEVRDGENVPSSPALSSLHNVGPRL